MRQTFPFFAYGVHWITAITITQQRKPRWTTLPGVARDPAAQVCPGHPQQALRSPEFAVPRSSILSSGLYLENKIRQIISSLFPAIAVAGHFCSVVRAVHRASGTGLPLARHAAHIGSDGAPATLHHMQKAETRRPPRTGQLCIHLASAAAHCSSLHACHLCWLPMHAICCAVG